MSRRKYTRRAALRTIGLGAVGTVAAGTGAAGPVQELPGGQRDDERVQFVEADPEAGFNFPYWLATPESFRQEPVPLLVTMNSADPGDKLTGGGPDQPPTVAERARSEVQSFKQVGAWASEQLGIPHLSPVFPMPDRTHRTKALDRETMLIEGTDLERIDRQLLRMTDHARKKLLADHQMHEQLLFWGNSSAGTAAQYMAFLHPEEIMAFAGAGINGIVPLPLETLGDHTLKYPIGIADYEEISGHRFDPETFDGVNKFYILGAHDTHKRLKFKVPGELPGFWTDPKIYETAKAVYGFDMAEDSLPRCHIAYEKAGISGQFRIYQEMTHDPEPAAPDVLEFLRRSIEGEDVSEFGQRLTLPFDRTVALNTAEPAVGDQLDFAVSGEYPPPEGLVTYTWGVNDDRSASGPEAMFTFEDAVNYEVTLSMETAHGQVTQRGMSLMASGGSTFAAYRYDVMPPRSELEVGQSILIELDVTNVGAGRGDRRVELFVDGDWADGRGAALEPGVSKRIRLSHPFDEPGEYKVRVPPAFKQTIPVHAEQTRTTEAGSTPTPTETQTPGSTTGTRDGTGTSAQGPGFGVVTVLAGMGVALSYILLKDYSDDG